MSCAALAPLAANTLSAIHGFASDDIWAVGFGGLIVHFDGTVWRRVKSPTRDSLVSLWGTGPSDLWAAGWGVIVHWDGSVWKASYEVDARSDWAGDAWLNAIWGSGRDDVWVAGDRRILHWDGKAWSVRENGLPENFPFRLRAILGFTRDDLWATGEKETIRWNGERWEIFGAKERGDELWGTSATDLWRVQSGEVVPVSHWDGRRWTPVPGADHLRVGAVWLRGPGEFWAAGPFGKIWRRREEQWTEIPTPFHRQIMGMWGSNPSDVWVVGGSPYSQEGLLVGHFDGTRWSPCVEGLAGPGL